MIAGFYYKNMVEGNRRFYIEVSRQPIAVKLVMTGGVNMNTRTPNANDENTDNQALRKRCTDVRTLYPLAWTGAAGTARYSSPHSEGERYYIRVRSDLLSLVRTRTIQ